MKVAQKAFESSSFHTVHIAATTTSANVQVQTAINSHHVRVVNTGTAVVFVAFGVDNTVAASVTTSMPVLPSTEKVFYSVNPWAAAITSTGTATVYFTAGDGM